MRNNRIGVYPFLRNLKADEKRTLINDIKLNEITRNKNVLSENRYTFPQSIENARKHMIYGEFIDCLIRKIITDKANKLFYDKKGELAKELRLKHFPNGNPSSGEKIYARIQELDYRECIEDIYKLSTSMNMEEDVSESIQGIFIDNIDNYFANKLKGKKKILINPCFTSSNLIYGEADLIIDDEVIDFKASKKEKGSYEDFLQLLLYACLYSNESGTKINKLTIYNPFLNYEISLDITRWNCQGVLFNWVYSSAYKMGFTRLISNPMEVTPNILSNLCTDDINKLIFDYFDNYKYYSEHDPITQNRSEIFVSGNGIDRYKAVIINLKYDVPPGKQMNEFMERMDYFRKNKISTMTINYRQEGNLVFFLDRFFSRIKTKGYYRLVTDTTFISICEKKKMRLYAYLCLSKTCLPRDIIIYVIKQYLLD